MKLNLMVNNLQYLNGYRNISPFAPVTDSRFSRNSVIDLEMLVDDGEADEIRAMDVLEYYPHQDIDQILNNWVRKLAHKGTITISGNDIHFIARQINTRHLNNEQALIQLYGISDKPGQKKQAVYSLNFITEKLKARGLKILKKVLMPDGQFIVTGERN